MTEQGFTIWLNDFFNNIENKKLTNSQIDIVRKKLEEVKFEKKDKSTILENKKNLILSC